MEMSFRVSYIHIKSASLFWGLLVLFMACTRTGVQMPGTSALKDSFQRLANSGQLLDSLSLQEDDYVFYFEKDTLEVPKQQIVSVAKQPEKWNLTLTLSDGAVLNLPYKGGALDFIIKSVTLNPSGYNPLAAMLDVKLPTFGRIRVTVEGKNGQEGTITHLFRQSTPAQKIPVLGLYADYDNRVELAFTDGDGKVRGTVHTVISTKALPADLLPSVKVLKSDHSKMEAGVNLINYPGASIVGLSTPYMLDREGQVRWILLLDKSPDLGNLSVSLGLARTQAGTFIAGDQNGQRVVEFDMLGNLVKQWDLKKLGYTFHHDIVEEKDGNLLITVNKIGAVLNNGQPRIQDHIIELNRNDGSLLQHWDLADMIDTSRYLKRDSSQPDFVAQTPTNWAHNNSIIPYNDYILTTMRYQGIIGYGRSGKLRWIISPHKYWKKEYQPYLLSPVDENGDLITDAAVISGDRSVKGFDWPWGPHTPVALSEDRFLIFDNGYNRHWVSNELTPNANYSRVVEYKIDENRKTVQQVWSYGEQRGAACFSQALSGVQYLPQTGNVLFCPGMGVVTSLGSGGRVLEIDPTTNTVVFEMELTASSSTAFYRVTRMPLYPGNL